MIAIAENIHTNLEESLHELKEATPLTKDEKARKLVSQLDTFMQTTEGIQSVYEKILEIEKAGVFGNSAWKDPGKLIPGFVKGTLRAGPPSASIEMLSELRMLAYAEQDVQDPVIKKEDAAAYIQEVIVHNLEFVFQDLTEESRVVMSRQELQKVYNLFQFIIDKSGLEGIKEKLAEEIRLTCEQRPVVTLRIRQLIHLVDSKLELNEDAEADRQLKYYVDALLRPSKLSRKYPDPEKYAAAIAKAGLPTLKAEAEQVSGFLKNTGLSNPYVAALMLHSVEKHPEILPLVLGLNDAGKAEWETSTKRISALIKETFSIYNYFGIYGLACMLERNLFTRSPVSAGLNNLRKAHILPQVEERILKTIINRHPSVTARQYLIDATVRMLGLPLGIGQGNNATCQSARGMSMWSQHAPAKLLNTIITVATQNNLIMRFENTDLESSKLGKGLIDELDYNLDPVSAVLVPHLDKVYNEMMRMSAGRGEDQHKWVNPALYGQWVQVGFASAYDYFTNTILDFPGFVRLFYAAFHPKYNGERMMVFPNPVGIFITTNTGLMVGFHAVSLLRVKHDPNSGEMRAYFLNPNNEGRQDWGQNIKPTVNGNGERHGESSLPFHEFAARLYAFHFNELEVKDNLSKVPAKEIDRVVKLASESWGKSYTWSALVKQWV